MDVSVFAKNFIAAEIILITLSTLNRAGPRFRPTEGGFMRPDFFRAQRHYPF